MILRRLLGLWRPDDGTAAIEAGIVLPVFMFLIVGIFDLGTGMYEKQAINAAAQAGAAYEVINLKVTGIAPVMNDAAGNMTGLTITNTLSNGIVTVTASHNFTPIFLHSKFAAWVTSPFNLSSSVTIRIQ